MRISDWSSDVCSSDLVKKTLRELLGGGFKSPTRRLERMERDACALLGLAPPASAADGLAAKVLADAHTRPGQDEALELLRPLLSPRPDCPAPALGFFGVGLLTFLTRQSYDSQSYVPEHA